MTIIDQRMSDALFFIVVSYTESSEPCQASARCNYFVLLRQVLSISILVCRVLPVLQALRMVPSVKLRVFNIVVKTPSGNFRVLQALEDYPDINMNLDPKDNKELPHRINLFYNDTCNVRVWQEVMIDHILSDILIGVQTPN